MMRLIVTLVLLLLLAGAATWEHHYIDKSYGRLAKDLDVLVASINTQVEEAKSAGKEAKDAKIDTPENIAKVNRMYKYWKSREKSLVMITKHFDLAQVSDALIYMKNFVEFSNAEEASAGAQRLRYLIDSHVFNFGANIQNVI